MLDCEEAERWIRQARYTLESSRADMDGGFHSWACFKAHQVAEYALKAVLRSVGVESFGHDLISLWRRAKSVCTILEDLHQCIALLNKMYIPPRYPDAWASGSAPYESYTVKDSQESIECATKILGAVEACINEACKDTQGKD